MVLVCFWFEILVLPVFVPAELGDDLVAVNVFLEVLDSVCEMDSFDESWVDPGFDYFPDAWSWLAWGCLFNTGEQTDLRILAGRCG